MEHSIESQGGNETGSYSSSQEINEELSVTTTVVLTAAALILVIIVTVFGNILVLVTIATDRNLRSFKSNYLLFSLAVADLFVGLLVMPLGAVQIITGQWLLGAVWCELWTFVDIMSSSSSILHLLSIAIDRHLSVSLQRLKWNAKRNSRSIYIMIACSWLIAALVAACPLLGWKDENFLERIEQKVCVVSQSLSFLFFGITVTFYLPLLLILIFYWRIWLAVRARHERRMQKECAELNRAQALESDADDSSQSNSNSAQVSMEGASVVSANEAKKRLDAAGRSQRAARTLAIITGAFAVCYSPYFISLPLDVLCGESCNVHPKWIDFTQWLGFANSMLNPIIYTIFSVDFRTAFRKTFGRLKTSF